MIEIPSLVVTGSINGERFELLSKEWLKIDRHQLDEELARQATTYHYIAGLQSRAERESLLIEADLADCDSDFAVDYRKDRKASETEIKQAINKNPLHRKLAREKIEVDQFKRDLDAFVYALVHRLEMLKSLSHSRNREMATPSPVEVDRAKRLIASRLDRTDEAAIIRAKAKQAQHK